jgi:hypothetical protein
MGPRPSERRTAAERVTSSGEHEGRHTPFGEGDSPIIDGAYPLEQVPDAMLTTWKRDTPGERWSLPWRTADEP